jgi:hypothetical protein
MSGLPRKKQLVRFEAAAHPETHFHAATGEGQDIRENHI